MSEEEIEEELVSDYDDQRVYVEFVGGDAAEHAKVVAETIETAFSEFIERREVAFVNFRLMTPIQLGEAIHSHPIILKCLCSACNIGGRSFQRDVGITVDTYATRIALDKAIVIATYLRSMLPEEIAVPALSELDRHAYFDKEVIGHTRDAGRSKSLKNSISSRLFIL